MVQHVVRVGDLALLVADDGERELRAGDLIDVLDPPAVRVDRVGRQPDELHAAPRELGLELGEGAEFYKRKVLVSSRRWQRAG